MFLYEIIYFSEKTSMFLSDEDRHFQDILSEATRHNGKKNITGMLFSSGGHFFQILEGARSEISDLLLRISRDPRNRNLTIVRSKPIPARRFAKWAMAAVELPNIENSRFSRYLTGNNFDPREFSDDTIDLFLMTAFTEVAALESDRKGKV